MKIAIGYPPFEDIKGTPLLSQNRQYRVFHNPTYIYPIVPATAATMLKKAGNEVFWIDGIAEKWRYQRWFDEVKEKKPDLIMIETKTPVVKRHWRIINQLKAWNSKFETVLVGDHVTVLPEESFINSKVDFVLTGGDYDFLLLNLVRYLTKKEKLEPGIFYREGKKVKNTGKFRLNHDLNKLPFIDRELTKWELYAYENGNYKRTPGTYTMIGRDCWWRKEGGCFFCSWCTLYPTWRVRKVEHVLDEIGDILDKYPVREIMDDSGTFPAGQWLQRFCQGMIKKDYHKKIYFNCNLRPGVLSQKDYNLMAQASFRMLLYGLESANQKTLDKINKGSKVSDIIKDCQMAKSANRKLGGHLEPHVTLMVGYPWETKSEAKKTLKMAKDMFNKGLIDSLQATIVVPYPGTKLFGQAKENGWLVTSDWEKFDMSQPVMKTPMKDGEVLGLVSGIYKSFITPRFLVKKAASVRSFDDVRFFWRAGKAVLGHLADFRK